MARDHADAANVRELITSDARALAGLWLVAAAVFDIVWVMITGVAISSFPKWLSTAVAALAFFAAILANVLAARKGAVSFDASSIWWSSRPGRNHSVPRATAKFGARRRFGIEQATISDGDGPAIVVPKLAVISWTSPDPTVAVREIDPETGKPGDWADLGARWGSIDPAVVERTIADDRGLTKALAKAQR